MRFCLTITPTNTKNLSLADGFTMTPNTSDHIPLDEHILPLLSSEQKAALEEANLLG